MEDYKKYLKKKTKREYRYCNIMYIHVPTLTHYCCLHISTITTPIKMSAC